MDANGLLYLRARYYSPNLGVFTALDPFEGKTCEPMSLNGYSYVAGNPVNMVDRSGMIYELPNAWSNCISDFGLLFIQQPKQPCMIGNTEVSAETINVIATAIYGEIRQGGSAALAISAAAAINKLRAGTALAAFGGYSDVPGLYGAVFIGVCGKTAFATSANNINYTCTNTYVRGTLNGEISESIGDVPSSSNRLMQVTLDHIRFQLLGHCFHSDGAYWYRRGLEVEKKTGVDAIFTPEIASKVEKIYGDISLRIAHTFDMRWASQLPDLECCMRASNQMKSSGHFDYVYAGYANDGALVSTEDMINKAPYSLQTFENYHICTGLKQGCNNPKDSSCYIFPRSVRQQCRGSSET